MLFLMLSEEEKRKWKTGVGKHGFEYNRIHSPLIEKNDG